MKLAVFSDVHGNLGALEAAWVDIEAAAPDVVWNLGDLAAFGARSAACVARIRQLRESFGKEKFHVIGGNTDRYLVTGERSKTPPAKDEEAFKKLADSRQTADQVLNWNLRQFGWEDYEWLGKILGRETSLDAKGYGGVIGYHAIPGDDEPLLTPETPAEEALDALLDREGRLGIGGHIHVQMDRDLGRWRLVNVGSVGMSGDMPGKAQWGLFTFDEGDVKVDLRAVPYDVAAAIADLHDSGHPAPEWAANRLRPKQE